MLAVAFTAFRPPPTHGPFARDFEAYYAAGAVWNAGGDPWSRAVWRVERTIDGVDRGEELLPFVGPAFVLPVFGALARLPFDAAQRLWSGALALAFGALVLGALALARESRAGALLAAFALGIASGMVVSDFALGQIAMFSGAGTACALAVLERRRVGAAALAVMLAGVQPNLAVALAARLRDRAAWIAAACGVLGFTAGTLLAGGGARGLADYVRRVGEHGAAERFVAIQYTPAAIAHAFGAAPRTALAAGTIIAIAAIAATAVAIARARLGAADGTLLALAALPLAVPFFHEHDFVVVLIPLIVLALRASGGVRAAAGAASACVAVDWFGLAQRPLAEAQILALGVAAALAFAALGRGARVTRADAAPLALTVALACVALPLARAHRAPTWPDALPIAYRAPTNASASAVWADEQRAAGLEHDDAAWGALRAIPLAGCVLLGGAIVRGARRRPERERMAG